MGNEEIISNNGEIFYLTKYFFHSKAWQYNKPSGYLTNHDNKIFTLSGDGELNFINISEIDKKNEKYKIKKIKTNLKEVVNNPAITKGKISFRGIMINNDTKFTYRITKKLKTVLTFQLLVVH